MASRFIAIECNFSFKQWRDGEGSVETRAAATAISELMVEKEIQLSTLRPIPVLDNRQDDWASTEIIRPFLKLKHRQRFQTRLSVAFEKMLTQ